LRESAAGAGAHGEGEAVGRAGQVLDILTRIRRRGKKREAGSEWLGRSGHVGQEEELREFRGLRNRDVQACTPDSSRTK
jgi:hypothetical protein